jgi:VanZ family protein
MRRDLLWPPLIALTLFVVSGQTQVATPPGFSFHPDKIGHFAVFGTLATSLVRLPEFRTLRARGALLAFLIATLYGGLDEWRQSFTPGRYVEFDDWLADTLGALTAVLLYTRCTPWRTLLELPVLPPQMSQGKSTD